MNNKKKIAMLVILSLLVMGGITGYLVYQQKTTNQSSSFDTVSLNTKDDSIDWSKYDGKTITLKESLTITSGGVYTLTGTLKDGNITINTEDNVKLILSNVSITSNDSPAIIVENAKNLVIELADGTKNYLEDGSTYSSTYSEMDGVIYSADDLFIQGTGTLEVKANHGDGIVSKDDLKITSGTYIITSSDDAIRGTDSVYIKDGSFTITSGGDGIKSTKEDDTSKGYVYIENGTFKITSSLDGISAVTKLYIEDGDFDITTGGGSSNSSTKLGWGMWNSKNTSTTTSSAKGLKSDDTISINGGKFELNTSDDAIHSNNYVEISKATLNITSGDDGVHADSEIVINSGIINISQSYEGIEASIITINDGDIKVVASDDGINVAGGNDQSSMNRPGENNVNSTSNNKLTINGGVVYVNSKGDGIDINGSGYVYGGDVTVEGPTDNGNAALDYDGEFVVDGGTVISVGSSGMLQGISSSSKQNNIIAYLSNVSANTKISIVDSNNKEVISYTPSKSYSSLVVSSSKLEMNQTYRILINGEEYQSFTVNSTTTKIGSNNGGGMMQGGGMPQGGMQQGTRGRR